ncbi:MAG: hypothetical protein ABI333_26210 [bacterium]
MKKATNRLLRGVRFALIGCFLGGLLGLVIGWMIHLLATLILTGKGSAWTPTSGMVIGGITLGVVSIALGFYVGFFRMEHADPAREQSAG